MNFILPQTILDEITDAMLDSQGISGAEFCESVYITNKSIIHDMALSGHIIGCHGHNHVPYSTLYGESLIQDVHMSKNCINDIVGENPTWVSYPYGSLPEDTNKFCNSFGFRVGISLQRDWNYSHENNYSALKRINTNEVSQYLDG